jgi:hypothetical protein
MMQQPAGEPIAGDERGERHGDDREQGNDRENVFGDLPDIKSAQGDDEGKFSRLRQQQAGVDGGA